jgi:CRISPR-associated protein Cst1
MPLFNWTGNPWVDTGIAAIQEWNKKQKPEDILKKDIENIAAVLVALYLTDAWKKSLFSVFPNNPITNPSIKNKKKELLEYYENLIEGALPIEKQGDCIACGRRNTVSGKNRMHIPMTGYEGSHFFSFKTIGVDYCEACTFAVQCSPLLFYRCGKLLLLHSNSSKVMRYWARKCISEVHRQMATRNFTGCFNEKYTNPINALFHIIQDLILSYDEQWIDELASIRIYHFTNYNQGPDLDIYDLPTPVFRFLAYVKSHPRYKDWSRIVYKGYQKSKRKPEEEYKNKNNSVYQSLLRGQAITGYFIDNKTKTAIGDWSLLKHYLKEVIGMDASRIEAIKRLGDEISELIKISVNGKKRLGQIERATNYASFRNTLLRLMRDNVALKSENPLFTFDDYAKYLFPEGAMGWKETQDLLLFRLYENLHVWLVSEGLVIEETEESEEVTI